MTTPDIHTLTGAYAVDALPDDERREFERHLDSCDACQQEVDELRTTAAQLAGAVAETPPAGMRAAVLAAIDDVRQERPATEVAAIDRGREWMPRVLGAAAAAFLLVVLGLTVIVSSLNSRLDDLDATNTQVTEVLAAEDLDTVELEGDVGTVRVAFSPTRGQGVLIGTGLEPLSDSRVYELWFLEGGDPVPAGLFTPDEQGRVTFAVNGDLGGVEAFAVTIEPEGGSPAPTTEPVLVGAV
ncbi:MAG: anti-sigma factor [Actinobacteria bacterium]|nr:anti-sigma factor [Actinomycetota bacterium]